MELGGWDYHDNLYGKLPANAGKLDKGLSSLLTHLTEKGLLDSTLVVVSTEFGRKPGVNPNKGRDHHPDGFTCLMAGAGVKAGQIYGTTTKDGESADEDVLVVTDFNAMISWRLGIDLGPRKRVPVAAPSSWPIKAKLAKSCSLDSAVRLQRSGV